MTPSAARDPSRNREVSSPLLRRRSAFGVLAVVALLTWRRRLAPFRPALLTGLLLALTGSVAATAWLGHAGAPDAAREAALPVTIGITTGLPLLASALAVIAGCAGADLTPAHRRLLVEPVGTRWLSLALAAPGLAAAGALVALLSPPLGVLLADLTGYGFLHALALVVLLTLWGLLLGRLVVVGTRVALSRRPLLHHHLTTVALLAWAGVAAASTWVVRSRMNAGVADELTGPGAEGLAALLSSWSVWLAFALRPRPEVVFAATAVLVVFLAVVWLSASAQVTVSVGPAPRWRARVAWRPAGAGQLTRLALHRALRHRRTLSWTVSGTVILLGMSLVVLWMDREAARPLVANGLLLTAQLSAYPALLARGLDRRQRPNPVVMGMSVPQYCRSWQLATALIAAALAVVPVTALTVVDGRAGTALAGGLMVAAATAAAHTVSAVTVIRPGDSASETVGGATLLLLLVAVGLAGARILGTTELLPVATVLAVVLLPMAALPTWIEHRRWRSAVGLPS
jgi:hypothetical protein